MYTCAPWRPFEGLGVSMRLSRLGEPRRTGGPLRPPQKRWFGRFWPLPGQKWLGAAQPSLLKKSVKGVKLPFRHSHRVPDAPRLLYGVS